MKRKPLRCAWDSLSTMLFYWLEKFSASWKDLKVSSTTSVTKSNVHFFLVVPLLKSSVYYWITHKLQSMESLESDIFENLRMLPHRLYVKVYLIFTNRQHNYVYIPLIFDKAALTVHNWMHNISCYRFGSDLSEVAVDKRSREFETMQTKKSGKWTRLRKRLNLGYKPKQRCGILK